MARRLLEFVAAHGGPGAAVVSYLGRPGARIVVVAEDGLFADAVVPSVEAGVKVCEQAGISVQTWTRDLTGKIDLSPADRRRMAGTGR